MQKLPREAFSEVLAWICRAKAALQSYCSSFCVELSCKSCLWMAFLKLSYRTVAKKLPFEATSHAFAWHCHTKVALRSYLLSFCMKLPCRSCLTKLSLKLLHSTVMTKLPCEAFCRAFACNCHAKAAFGSYFFSFRMELLCKRCLLKLSLKLFN